ncbi:DNA/RNA non-specific endonuclease [Clostridium polynesiense]|uniref:DNA/RNA non-specific endonuclease n=1 Tax=Clostridium polynesiense TaxID=1325933 RepID=UPI000A732D31|nr:DNA/RNA non-specific endonuclease [Clostridium polynesiense]
MIGIAGVLKGIVKLASGITIGAAGAATTSTGIGVILGSIEIAVSVPIVAVGAAEASVSLGIYYASKKNYKNNLEKFNSSKRVDLDDVDLGKEAEKLKDGASKAELEVRQFNEEGKLISNIKYKAGEYDYLYETDELGRISKFETDNLKLTVRENRLPHNPDTPGKLDGDHEGHLAGDRFGGSPELDNLVSQSSNVNLSQYKKIENQWATAIKEGKQVKVNIEIKYDGDSLRPSEFNVRYEIDGKRYRKSILN